jgi:Na+-translocating ferredoxin:NAD+ oxidoreductase subunit B
MIAAIASLSFLGLFFGATLGIASRYLAVEVGGLQAELEEMMPGSNCGQCGYPGCAAAAQALATGDAQVTLCPPGGRSLAVALADRLGKSADLSGISDRGPVVAFIHEDACIGCGRCFRECPSDSIMGGPKQMHTVFRDLCNGCGACVADCPTHCIELQAVPVTLQTWHWPKPNLIAKSA